MNRSLQSLLAIALILGIGIPLWFFVVAVEVPPPTAPPRDLGPVLVRTRSFEPRPVVLTVEAYGNLEPRRRVAIVPEVSGRLVFVNERWRPGVRVEEGELLVGVEKQLYDLEVRAARAGLDEAEAGVATADVDLRRAQQAYEKAVEQRTIAAREYDRLVELGSFASESLRDQAQAALVSAELSESTTRIDLEGAGAAVEARKARVGTAQAALERARENLARTELRAPFPGRLRGQPPGLGTLASPGQVLGELLDPSTLVLAVRVPERDLLFLRRGMPAEIDFPSDPGTAALLRVDGRVTAIDAASDPSTRRGTVEVELSDPTLPVPPEGNGAGGSEFLPSGLFARARIEVERLEEALWISRKHLRWIEGRPVAYVLGAGDAAERRELTLEREHDEGYLLRSGIVAGETLITHPLDRLSAGTQVRPAGDER